MNSYRVKKERERTLFSCAVVAGFILLLFLISLIPGLFRFEDFNEYTGPVKITFGVSDGIDELLDNSEIMDPKDMVEPIVKPEPVVEIEPEPVDDISEVITEPEVVEPAPVIEPVEEVTNPVNKPEVDTTTTNKPNPVVKPAPEPKPVVQKGEENGNSHETTFESTSSKIGRSAYFPIYQFMPLPKSLSEEFFKGITGDVTGFDEENYNRNKFLQYYSLDDSGNYILDDRVSLQSRPELWSILEDSDYDMENPEYKSKYNLNYVIISFEIESNSNGSNAIKSAKIESTSGNRDIDNAVLYGFKQSTYSNGTSENVKGRFKYSFK